MFAFIHIFHRLRVSFNKLEDSVIEIANGNLDKEIDIPNESLLIEITLSIKKMTERLKNQIIRLKQLEEYKSDFFQNVSHEIKTPITAINSAIELLQTKNSIKNTDKECFDIIQFQTQSINKLVNDILCLSEIDLEKTGEKKSFKQFNLNQMIRNTINYLMPKDVQIIFIENCIADISADEELLATALSNLIINTLKYSESDKIDVILLMENNHIVLKVRDYGIGIPEKHLDRIFERFYRVDKNRSRESGGTGLGLSIVKNVVELHNGDITVFSEPNKETVLQLFCRRRNILLTENNPFIFIF